MHVQNFSSPGEIYQPFIPQLKKQYSLSTFRFESAALTPLTQPSPLYLPNSLKPQKKVSQSSRLKLFSETYQDRPKELNSKSSIFNTKSNQYLKNEFNIKTHPSFSSLALKPVRIPITSRDNLVQGMNIIKVTQKKLTRYKSELKLANKRRPTTRNNRKFFISDAKPTPFGVKGRCMSRAH